MIKKKAYFTLDELSAYRKAADAHPETSIRAGRNALALHRIVAGLRELLEPDRDRRVPSEIKLGDVVLDNVARGDAEAPLTLIVAGVARSVSLRLSPESSQKDQSTRTLSLFHDGRGRHELNPANNEQIAANIANLLGVTDD
jgi:hypothetical protein